MNFGSFAHERSGRAPWILVALRRGERGEPRLHARAADGTDHRVEVVAHSKPMVSSGKSLSSTLERTLELDANLIETEEADGRECRHYRSPQPELRREYNGSVKRKIWKIFSNWQ